MVQGFKLRWTSLYIEVIIYRLVTSLEEICVQLDLFTDHLMVPPCSGPCPDRPVAAPFMINANVLANVHNNIDIYPYTAQVPCLEQNNA